MGPNNYMGRTKGAHSRVWALLIHPLVLIRVTGRYAVQLLERDESRRCISLSERLPRTSSCSALPCCCCCFWSGPAPRPRPRTRRFRRPCLHQRLAWARLAAPSRRSCRHPCRRSYHRALLYPCRRVLLHRHHRPHRRRPSRRPLQCVPCRRRATAGRTQSYR